MTRRPNCLEQVMPGEFYSFEDKFIRGIFVERSNRFLGVVRTDRGNIRAHIPNSGRLPQLLIEGAEVALAHRPSDSRKTDYDIILAKTDEDEENTGWSLVDSRLPMDIFDEYVASNSLLEFSDMSVKREVTAEENRMDYLLTSDHERCWVELKSVTLVANTRWGVEARFPDSPTSRGVRQLNRLAELRQSGDRSAVVFIVCRSEAEVFAPNVNEDSDFARALFEVAQTGVEIYAYRLDSTLDGCVISERIPTRCVFE